MGQRLSAREEKKEGTGGGRTHTSLQAQLSEVEGALERERSKVKQLEGELVTHTVVKEGMDRDMEKVCAHTCMSNIMQCNMVVSS